MKNDFIITLNSNDTTSWTGSNIYNCNYFVNLDSVFNDSSNSMKEYEKTYKLTFSFKSNKSVYFIGKAIGLFINNITYTVKNQQNLNQTFLLGVLKTTTYNNAYILDATTIECDNPVVILQGLNNMTSLSLNITTLLSSTLYNNTLTGLGNVINLYKCLVADVNAGTVYNYKTLAYDGVLTNSATITTDGILDLTSATSYMAFPNFNWTTYPTNTITFSCWFNTTNINTFSLMAIDQTRITITNNNISGYFNSNQIFQYTGGINAGWNFSSGKWFNVQWMFGNCATHKLYINGNLAITGTNTDFTATGLTINTYIGKNRTTANYINGYMSDIRLYQRELTQQEIIGYYTNHSFCQLPDYRIKLHLEENE